MLVDRKDGFAILNAQSEVPMTAIDVQTLYDYSYWANAKLFDKFGA